jgi:hypothetical protein
MSDPEHENQRCGVVNPRDHPEVAGPVSPKFAEAVALQRLADRTGVINRSDPVAKEAKNARGGLWTVCRARARRRVRTQLSTP